MEFLSPWLLLGLLALPILWWILRAIPPMPVRIKFPAVVLLLGLKDPETTPDRTPWWLLLLRLMAVACLIIGFASPFLRSLDRTGDTQLVIALDASWASAQSWPKRVEKVTSLLENAASVGRPVTVIAFSDTPKDAPLAFSSAGDWMERSLGLTPAAWAGRFSDWTDFIQQADGKFDTVWLSDGLADQARLPLFEALSQKGQVRVIEEASVVALSPPNLTQDGLSVSVQRVGTQDPVDVALIGTDPSGAQRTLAVKTAGIDATVDFDLPLELRNRITRIDLVGKQSAGAVQLVGTRLQKRKVALIEGRDSQEAALLTSPLHFLRKALVDTAQVIEGPLDAMLLASPDVIVVPDGPADPVLETWVKDGGLLVRFAGPQLSALDIELLDSDPLLPVRLRGGGRSIGGALSWGTPKQLAKFPETSPFFGLGVPSDVTVSRQVMAQPDPNLSQRVLATLKDGTPLVTADTLGAGRVVLFHVTASAEWSNLPISGLFVQMLDRLAISATAQNTGIAGLEDQIWMAVEVLDGFGTLQETSGVGVKGSQLITRDFGADFGPGIYTTLERRVVVNVIEGEVLSPAKWPIDVEPFTQDEPLPLKAILLCAAVALLALDVMASLWMTGRLKRGLGAAIAVIAFIFTGGAEAQDDQAIRAANNTVLAYVITGDSLVDDTSRAGLLGLSNVLNRRTSIEPIAPTGVVLGRDELAFYPLLYWPITEDMTLSAKAVADINAFMRTGGLILFDTRDANLGGLGTTPAGQALRRLSQGLDIPALEPIPDDHVLTRAFYLLSDFPGRQQNTDVWVEAAPPGSELAEGAPFRNLNDGVTPVIIGGNDWASAWAINDRGQFLFPVGRGFAGEKQREMAFRFGINLVMYVMTGNYKSDQVHVPALLDRLGQ